MNVIVLVKQIPDPNTPYQLAGNRLKRDGAQNVLDPGDEFGVEAALQLTEANGGEVTVVSMGPAAAMEKAGFDLVIAGVESTDGSTGTVPGTIAELLGAPLASFAKHLEVKDTTLHIQRQTEKGYDDVESPLPAVLTVTAGVNEPRYPTIKGIKQAKSKPVEQLKVADLGLSADDAKSTQNVAEVTPAPARGAGEKFEDDGTGAAKVADFLKEAKVI